MTISNERGYKNKSAVVSHASLAYFIDFTERIRCLLLKFAWNSVFNNGVPS